MCSVALCMHHCNAVFTTVSAQEQEKEGDDVAGETLLAEGGKDDTKKPEPPEAPSLSFSFVMALTGCAVWVGHGICAQRCLKKTHIFNGPFASASANMEVRPGGP